MACNSFYLEQTLMNTLLKISSNKLVIKYYLIEVTLLIAYIFHLLLLNLLSKLDLRLFKLKYIFFNIP